MNVTIMGCGRWGTFLAWYQHRLGNSVLLWGRQGSPHLLELQANRRNEYLCISEEIVLTSDLSAALAHGEVLILAIGAQQLRNFLTQISGYDLSQKTIVLCMKGLEEGTGKRLSEVVQEILPSVPVAIWVGPGHVQDFYAGVANCMVIDSEDESVTQGLVSAFSSDLIRFYYGADLIGNEVGAAAKNVVGIAAGMLDGLGRTCLKGALMSRGTREISRLIRALGGNELSAYGLAHLGDYEATVFSKHSHNRTFGERYVLGEPYGKLAEGVATVKAIVELGERLSVELPICNAVYRILYQNQDPKEALSALFLRSIKQEF